MCKLHGYHYACGHLVRYRLSRCRGTFTKIRRRQAKYTNVDHAPRLAACVAECYIVITSRSLCGSCLYEQYKLHWNVRISDAERAYREALDQGMKTGLGLVGWGGVGWGGGDMDDDGSSDGYSDGYDDDDGGCTNGDPETTTANRKASNRKRKRSLKDEIECRRHTLEHLRAEFSAESWSVRKRLPTLDHRSYTHPRTQPRVSHVPSPLRNEVRPEDIAIKQTWNGKTDSNEGWGHYPTFQAFFVDTYGGGPDTAWEDDAAALTVSGAWDPTVVANINFANSMSNDTQEPTGDESYYTEYNRFNTSHDDEDDGLDEKDDTIPVMAYGPETRSPPLMRDEDLLASGPNAAPPSRTSHTE
ncbi:uncharacterized protein BKCO1_1300041 [Diplodia corticola]|uniref:Uncharacterized protein n=1 Tax=Diplodia corticola TaxID=236234 RepID=A0A1J9S900_9PEZI|nr:uncharacterized protein BKCO1_1300041 [Diplodia corticola]OJD36061.1 hypothetical protein BKCO1_1300041 [Diplodia corticola]